MEEGTYNKTTNTFMPNGYFLDTDNTLPNDWMIGVEKDMASD